MTPHCPDIAAARARLAPGDVALEDVLSGLTLSYGGLDGQAGRAAGLLAATGVGSGDRVAVLCRNRIEFWELLFACARIGAIAVPLCWRSPAAELLPLLTDCAPALIAHGLVDAGTALARAAATGVACLDLDGSYARARDAAPVVAAPAAYAADAPWFLLYTSGTTGRPKAVVYTHGMVLANHVMSVDATGLHQADATLCYLPLFHTAGLNLHALPTLFAGGRLLLLGGFDAPRTRALLASGRLSVFFAVPAVYQALTEAGPIAPLAHPSVRWWGCGGAPIGAALHARYLDAGITICGGMGMTETGPTAFLASPESARAKPGTIGRAQLLAQTRIVDAQGRVVGAGESGEIQFAGPGVTPGYWRQPEATAAAFTADGWLRSGDIGYRDDDGDHFIVGRAKDMFITGGENVYPAEVEAALLQHPAIAEAAVVAAPDARWGEVGIAYVRLQSGAALPPESTLRDFLRARLAAFKLPQRFEVVADFPRTAAGKIIKHHIARASGERAA